METHVHACVQQDIRELIVKHTMYVTILSVKMVEAHNHSAISVSVLVLHVIQVPSVKLTQIFAPIIHV